MPIFEENLRIGADLGGTSLRMALIDQKGQILFRHRQPTFRDRSVETILQQIAKGVDLLRTEAHIQGKTIQCMGIGVPGLVEPKCGAVSESPNFPEWKDVPLQALIEDCAGMPAKVENDVNAIAVGEMRYGSAAGQAKSSITITLGTGVGGGLILDGKLWRGVDGSAGEIGHMVVQPGGRRCSCGNKGCLEAYASATAISEQAAAMKIVLPENASADKVAYMARQGCAEAVEIFDSAAEALGAALASVANLLNIDAAIIGGGVSGAWDLLELKTKNKVNELAFKIPARRLKIIKTSLLDDAGALGASHLAGERLGQLDESEIG